MTVRPSRDRPEAAEWFDEFSQRRGRKALRLDPGDAATPADQIDGLLVGETGHWEFSVVFNGKQARLVVAAYKDDVEAPDVYFFSSPDVVDQIDKDLAAISEANGS